MVKVLFLLLSIGPPNKAFWNFSLFKFQGREMDTLALYTKNVISERIYNDVIDGKNVPDKIGDLDVVKTAEVLVFLSS